MIFILYILQYLLGFCEIYMCFLVLNKIYKTCSSKKEQYSLVIFGIALAIVENFNRSIRLYSMILIVFMILTISLAYKVIFRKKFWYTVLYTSLYLYSLALLDLFVIFIVGISLKQNNIGVEIGRVLNMERILALILARGIVLSVYLYIIKDRRILPFKHIKTLFVILCTEIIGVYYFQSVYAGGTIAQLAARYFVYLIIIVLGIISFFIYVIYREVAEESKFILLRNNMLEHNYEELKSYYNESRTLFHDYKAHIALLQKYLEEGNIKKAQTYITDIARPLYEIEKKISTGIDVVDLIVNYKFSDIKEKKIHFDYDVANVDIVSLGIEESDLFVILYNLITNAIEACEKISNDSRWISLTITKINNMFMINICNSIQEIPECTDGALRTSKVNKKYHGIGLNSVKNIIEKYDALFKYTYDTERFDVTITFF